MKRESSGHSPPKLCHGSAVATCVGCHAARAENVRDMMMPLGEGELHAADDVSYKSRRYLIGWRNSPLRNRIGAISEMVHGS
jgi:hypothetical protein